MKLIIILILFYSFSFSQSFSDKDIKSLAQKVNDELKGTDIGNGVTIRGCIEFGRTLIYQYDVEDNWASLANMREDIIANYLEGGVSDLYAKGAINVDFHYYNGNSLRKKLSITYKEFLNVNFRLGNYISLEGHSKAKDVNMKIKTPLGWVIKEGDRPNIVMCI